LSAPSSAPDAFASAAIGLAVVAFILWVGKSAPPAGDPKPHPAAPPARPDASAQARASFLENDLGLLESLGDAFVVVEQDGVGTEGFELVDQFRPADEVEGAEAEMGGELDEGATDAGIGGVLDHPGAFFERGVVLQQRPGGDGIDAQHAGLHAVDLRRDPSEVVLRGGEVLRPATGSEEGNDDVSRAQGGDGRADGFDFSTAFMAGDAGGMRRASVGAFDEIDVSRIDGRVAHADTDLMA
jgi:hypothetical protein